MDAHGDCDLLIGGCRIVPRPACKGQIDVHRSADDCVGDLE